MNNNPILYIKNMVCERCIRVVREELEKIGLHLCHIELGKVEIEQVNNDLPLEAIRRVLLASGFYLWILLPGQRRIGLLLLETGSVVFLLLLWVLSKF
jgi:copper chaperone CopZ